MTKMRCLNCGRMVPLGNFKTLNEVRCACGRFILEPSQSKRTSSPRAIVCESKSRKVPAQLKSKTTVIDDQEECTS